MYDRNCKTALFDWVSQVLAKARDKGDITDTEKSHLYEVAARVIEKDGLRGDVSTMWINLGYGHSKLPNLYT